MEIPPVLAPLPWVSFISPYSLGERTKCPVRLERWLMGVARQRSLLPAMMLSWKKWASHPGIWLVPFRLNVLSLARWDGVSHDFQAYCGPLQASWPPPINDPAAWNGAGWTLPKGSWLSALLLAGSWTGPALLPLFRLGFPVIWRRQSQSIKHLVPPSGSGFPWKGNKDRVPEACPQYCGQFRFLA